MEHATVSHQLALSLLSAAGDDLPLFAELRYSAHDPLAVEALFDDGSPTRSAGSSRAICSRPGRTAALATVTSLPGRPRMPTHVLPFT